MANIRKQFNFRNGVQVDDDNLVVSPTGLVGIGTTIPTEILDVRGTAKVVGLVTANQIFTPDLTATTVSITSLSLGESIIGGGVSIRSGIITASGSGVVTYYGDGGRLSNLPTSQWLDVDIGLGFTSIYSQGYVGVGTADPRFLFQISGTNSTTLVGFTSGVGFSSEGNILATGIVTAYKFVGIGSDLAQLNASNLAYGTISNDRIPTLLNSKLPTNISVSGIITATSGFIGSVTGNVTGNLIGNVTGDVVGIASTARTLTGNPDIAVNNVTATSIAVTSITNVTSIGATNINLTGVGTLPLLHIGIGGTAVTITSNGRIGIGSNLPSEAIQIIKDEIATIEVVGSEARLILAEERSGVSVASSSGIIRYGNADKTFELLNQAPGNFNSYLHSGGPGVDTGRFGWVYGQNFSELMSLTYTGRLGLGKTDPDNTLHVVGTSTVTGNAWFGGDVTIAGDLNITSIQLPSLIENSNIYVTSGISTFNYIDADRIGINTNSPSADIDAKSSTALFANVGVGTNLVGSAKLKVIDGFAEFSSVGIGTTTLYSIPGEGLNSGNLQLHNNDLTIFGGSILIDNSPVSSLGFGTFIPRSIVDFGNVGAAASTGFMILPTLNSSQKLSLAYNLNGSVIFNSTDQEFQGYANNTWTNLGITTAIINATTLNVSGISTFNNTVKVGTGVTIQSGIVTAMNGFLSGIGTAVQITTVGNQLVFTVPGVGTTSLTLL